MKYTPFKPKWGHDCLCGSGKKYRDCCWQRLQGFDIGKQYQQAVKEKNFERALLACRADIVQYTIWHKSHTAPLLERNEFPPKLLRIDVNALASYLNRLLWLYFHTNRGHDWLSVMGRLRTNIRHIRWYRKIAYFRALSHLGSPEDLAKARHELDKMGSFTPDEDDVELLQLYVQLEFDSLSFSKRLAYLDRILELDDDLANQLQYRRGKAVQHFFIGDNVAGKQELLEAMNLAREAGLSELSVFEREHFAYLLQMLGAFTGNSEALDEAITQFNELLLSHDFTTYGRASLLEAVGECHKFSGRYEKAGGYFSESLAIEDRQIVRIHLAESLLYQKKIDASIIEIDKVDRVSLNSRESNDFAFTYGAISIWSESEERLNEAKSLLAGVKPAEPYFNERRLQLLLGVTNALASGKVSAKARADSIPKGGLSNALSNFVMLQPNFGGIGLNFNVLIEYLANRKQRKLLGD